MPEAPTRARPPLRVRLIGRVLTETIARVPGAWRVLRRTMERIVTRRPSRALF
jgi:hypothetical protein